MRGCFTPFVLKGEINVSDINFTNLLGWNFNRKYRISKLNGNIVIMYENKGKLEFLPPVGCNKLTDTVLKCLELLKQLGQKPIVRMVCEKEYHELDKSKFQIEEDTANADYVYKIKELIDMPGKKFSGIRNDINYLQKKYNFKYRPLTLGLVKYAEKFERTWYHRRRLENPEDKLLEHEHKACLHVLNNYSKLKLVGGVLFINGLVKGFIISDRMSKNMMTGHFLKATRSIRGAYPILKWSLAKQIKNNIPKIEFINAEQDLGLEGLRYSKEHSGSYFKVRKYTIMIK